MKKIILVLLAVVSLSSCSKDEETKIIYTNKIVGTWETTIVTIKNTTTNVIEDITPSCPAQFSFTGTSSEVITSPVLANGSHTLKYYAKNSSNVCTLQNTYNFSWNDLTNGNYGLIDLANNSTYLYNVVFLNNDKSMILTEQDGPEHIITYGLVKK